MDTGIYQESKWNPKVLSWKTLAFFSIVCLVVFVLHFILSLNWVVQEELSETEVLFRHSRLAPMILLAMTLTIGMIVILWAKTWGARLFLGMFFVMFFFVSAAVYQAEVRVSEKLYLHRAGVPLFPKWHRVNVTEIDHIQIVTRKYYRMSRHNAVRVEEYLLVSLSDGSTVRLGYGSQVTKAATEDLIHRLEARNIEIEEKYIDETR